MRKTINIILLLIVLISLISISVNAAPRFIQAGLGPIEDFFSGGWQNYEKTVAFIVFFFLFFSAFLIGAKKAFKELTRSHITFVFVAAFLSSFIIVTTLKFDWINLEYVAWGLIGVLVLFTIHSLLCKLGLEKHKFWAFILALIIAGLLLGLLWYLMNEGRPLDNIGRWMDKFRDLGGGAGEGGEPKPEGAAPIQREPVGGGGTPPAGTQPPPGPAETQQKGGFPWGKSSIAAIIIVVFVWIISRKARRGINKGIGWIIRKGGAVGRSIISLLTERCQRLINKMRGHAEQGNAQGVDDTLNQIGNAVNDTQTAAEQRAADLNGAVNNQGGPNGG